MHEAKNTQRALVRIGFDGRVHKTFRGPNAEERFATEVRMLQYLELRKCPFVPRLLEFDRDKLGIVTSNCGAIVQHISEDRAKELFDELLKYGVRHDDPYPRNITYRASDGRFCVIDFEFAAIIDEHMVEAKVENAAEDKLVKGLTWSGQTDRGKFRSNNEDAFLTTLLDRRGIRYLGKTGSADLQDTNFVFAVSDGMGGERSGEFASRIALEKITLMLPKQFAMSDARFAAYSGDILHELLSRIHEAMLDLGRYDPNCLDMGATLTLAWFRSGSVCFGHIGDSRLYHLPAAGGIHQVTEDHTHVGWLRRTGKLNEREARMHPRKNVLSQALGAGHRYLHPHIGMLDYQPGDLFVLCSDGVTEGLWDRGIEELVRGAGNSESGQSKAARLVSTAVSECGRDNATAVVIEAY